MVILESGIGKLGNLFQFEVSLSLQNSVIIEVIKKNQIQVNFPISQSHFSKFKKNLTKNAKSQPIGLHFLPLKPLKFKYGKTGCRLYAETASKPLPARSYER
jgi:hypothetical protein